MESNIPKDIKKQIIEVLKKYKDFDFLLEQLDRNLESVLNEEDEYLIYRTQESIRRDRSIIDDALASLDEKHQECFDLRFIQGLSATEVVTKMHLDRSTTYTHINHIVGAVASQIQGREGIR